ncbi:uncharacterized protein LOC129906154 [Episyrphus balteatus]|uniref:uncharacterized protein LOC129906154 n=1 Tax=Episyrphus balteatus TaxID=286459 RepID=UPI002484E3CB|nr:uncharacterized protein LOC129906154 [Episyrphus balteatus]
MRSILIAAGILLTLKILITDSRDATNFKKAVCLIVDKTVFTNYSCSAKPISRYKTIINIAGHLGKRVDEMSAHLQMFKKVNVVYRPYLVNVTEDFCLRFEKKTSAPYLNILHSIGEKYTNLNHTCPYEVSISIRKILKLF